MAHKAPHATKEAISTQVTVYSSMQAYRAALTDRTTPTGGSTTPNPNRKEATGTLSPKDLLSKSS